MTYFRCRVVSKTDGNKKNQKRSLTGLSSPVQMIKSTITYYSDRVPSDYDNNLPRVLWMTFDTFVTYWGW